MQDTWPPQDCNCDSAHTPRDKILLPGPASHNHRLASAILALIWRVIAMSSTMTYRLLYAFVRKGDLSGPNRSRVG